MKKGVWPDNNAKMLAERLVKYFLDKYNFDWGVKFNSNLASLETEIKDVLNKFPDPREVKNILYPVVSFVQAKFEKKLLQDSEEMFGIFVRQFKQHRQQLRLPAQMEGYWTAQSDGLPTESLSATRISVNNLVEIRHIFTSGLADIVPLEFDKVNIQASTKRVVMQKWWNSKPVYPLPTKMHHCIAIDTFLKTTVVPIASSVFCSLGYDFGLFSKLSAIFKTIFKFLQTGVNYSD